jgi:hypothetical protein
VVEKEWFDNFLSYKNNEASEPAATNPGKINNRKLLSSCTMMNSRMSSSEIVNEQNDSDNGKLEDDERRLRRRKWQGIQERNMAEEEKKGDELLGGNLLCRPELREGVDYVIVGKETWTFFLSHFSCDVELPQQQQQQTASLDSTEMSNSVSDSKKQEMDAGSSVAVARSASSLISEGSLNSDSGDELVSFLLQVTGFVQFGLMTHICVASLHSHVVSIAGKESSTKLHVYLVCSSTLQSTQ